MIDRDTFINTIFADITDGESVCVSEAKPKSDGTGSWFNNCLLTDRSWRKWDKDKQARAWYFCVSAVTGELNDKGTMVKRGRANLTRVFALVLDDIGTKAVAPPVSPSWKLESSPNNYQWGYLLDPSDDIMRFEALVEYCHQQGWGDAGAGGSYRLMRVPGSANLKDGRDNFRSRVTHWKPTFWSIDELAEDFGCDLNTVPIPDKTVAFKQGGAQAMENIDPLLDWLTTDGHVISDTGSQFVDVVCPWADAHTSGDNKAGYSPLGRGDGKYVQTRAFSCLHEHCKKRKLKDFVEWAVSLDGPFVAGYDPLPWLQSQYAYVVLGQVVVDLAQRKIGGDWVYPLADWKLDHPGKVTVAGHDRPILVANAFIEHENTKKVRGLTYVPVARADDTGVVMSFKQQQVNKYVPPNWEETTATPDVFLDHINYLIPYVKEREVFLNWLAYKIQHPASRSYCIVMVAEDSYGTGRSWLNSLLKKVLQGGVNTATLPQLIGKGTSSEQNFNSWKVGCQFIVVEEAKDVSLTRDDFYHGYETFKLNVDTKIEEDLRVNEKYGRTRNETAYYNVLIFTNHADAMALPENDRRVYCVENPAERLGYDYYDRLNNALDTDEPRRVFWWLMRRDVSKYDHIYPPMTPAKQRMISDTQSPSDSILEWIRANHPSDVITKTLLKTAIVVAANDLELEKQMREPSQTTKILWRKIKSLRPKDTKNGARYSIEGKQVEVRAIRKYEFWGVVDQKLDRNKIIEEMAKTEVFSNVVNLEDKNRS